GREQDGCQGSGSTFSGVSGTEAGKGTSSIYEPNRYTAGYRLSVGARPGPPRVAFRAAPQASGQPAISCRRLAGGARGRMRLCHTPRRDDAVTESTLFAPQLGAAHSLLEHVRSLEESPLTPVR